MPNTVGGGISILNQGRNKLSLALDCSDIIDFSFRPYIQYTASISNHKQALNSQNPCPGSILRSCPKMHVWFLRTTPHPLLRFKYLWNVKVRQSHVIRQGYGGDRKLYAWYKLTILTKQYCFCKT